MKRTLITSAVLAVGMAAMAAAPAHAGLLDGSLNNLDLLDHISVLDSNINSDPETVENRNANTRADGLLGNAVGLLR